VTASSIYYSGDSEVVGYDIKVVVQRGLSVFLRKSLHNMNGVYIDLFYYILRVAVVATGAPPLPQLSLLPVASWRVSRFWGDRSLIPHLGCFLRCTGANHAAALKQTYSHHVCK
jgi:hypothetical protein